MRCCYPDAVRPFAVVAAILLYAHGAALADGTNRTPKALQSHAHAGRLARAYGDLPLAFEPNAGQTGHDVRFLARGPRYGLFLGASEAVLVRGGVRQASGDHAGAPQRLVMRFIGASQPASVSGANRLPGTVNYLTGRNPSSWRTDLPTFRSVRYRGLYPGIDLVFYGNQRRLEYDFTVAAHQRADRIALSFSGARRACVTSAGDLDLDLPSGPVVWRRPVAYQEVDGRRLAVPCRYALHGAIQKGRCWIVRFVAGKYDHSRPLVIDPLLVYATYLGGSSDDYGYGVAVDAAGNAYLAGYTTSANFPVTPGAFQTTYKGYDAFVTKLNRTGTAIVYSTFLGGSANDQGLGICVDTAGEAIAVGQTLSADFPITANAFQPVYGGVGGSGLEAFLTKLNASGSALLYSTYLGGTGPDFATGCAVDASGNVYVAGQTLSSNFPTTASAFQTTLAGGSTYGDAFVSRIDTTKSGAPSLIYSTYLGGSGDDFALADATDGAGAVYVTGLTTSSNFPTTPTAAQTAFGGAQDAFVAKLDTTKSGASSLIYSTYVGGSGYDYGAGIAVDASGAAYVCGYTESANFPITPGAYQTSYGGAGDAFVEKVNPAGTAFVYGTFLGGAGTDKATSIAVDGWGNAYVAGYTNSANFPVTPGAYQSANAGGYDAFLTRLNAAGSTALYSTYLGGSADDQAFGVAVDLNAQAYLVGATASTNLPVQNAIQPASAGGNDALIALIRTSVRGDFNGDGLPDLVFQNPSTGQLAVWYMNGTTAFAGAFVTPTQVPAWKAVGEADFNGDGQTDILFQNPSTGRMALWYMSGVHATTGTYVYPLQNPAWQVVAVADINRDGKPDIVFQNSGTGQLAVWYMNGAVGYAGAYITPGQNPAWTCVGAADFNGDGQPDLLFQNFSTGQLAIWYMNGTNAVGGAYVTPAQNPAWRAVAVTDLPAGGHPDIYFQNTSTGQLAVWYMNGSTAVSGAYITPFQSPSWPCVGPR